MVNGLSDIDRGANQPAETHIGSFFILEGAGSIELDSLRRQAEKRGFAIFNRDEYSIFVKLMLVQFSVVDLLVVSTSQLNFQTPIRILVCTPKILVDS